MGAIPDGMERWRFAWREGVAPLLPLGALEAMSFGLACDDPAIGDGMAGDGTTVPPPFRACAGWPVERCCPLSYGLWQDCTGGRGTVEQVHDLFAALVDGATQRLGAAGPGLVGALLTWVDTTPRADMLRDLGEEVDLARLGRSTQRRAACSSGADVDTG